MNIFITCLFAVAMELGFLTKSTNIFMVELPQLDYSWISCSLGTESETKYVVCMTDRVLKVYNTASMR